MSQLVKSSEHRYESSFTTSQIKETQTCQFGLIYGFCIGKSLTHCSSHKSMGTNQICLQSSFKALDGTESYTQSVINPNSYFCFSWLQGCHHVFFPPVAVRVEEQNVSIQIIFSLINYSKVTLCVDESIQALNFQSEIVILF